MAERAPPAAAAARTASCCLVSAIHALGSPAASSYGRNVRPLRGAR